MSCIQGEVGQKVSVYQLFVYLPSDSVAASYCREREREGERERERDELKAGIVEWHTVFLIYIYEYCILHAQACN